MIDRADFEWSISNAIARGRKIGHDMKTHPLAYMSVIPTEKQSARMGRVERAAKAFSDVLNAELIDGHDKAHVLRTHRTTVLWAKTAIIRDTDGSPRMNEE